MAASAGRFRRLSSRASVVGLVTLVSALGFGAPSGSIETAGPSAPGWSEAVQVSVPDSSGNVLVAAGTTEGGVLTLVDSSGALVSTFGTAGIAKLPLWSDLRMVYDPTSTTGPIVVAGVSAGYLMVHRFTSSGAPDTTFANGGALRIDVESSDTWSLGGLAMGTVGDSAAIHVAGAYYGSTERGIRLVRIIGDSFVTSDMAVPGIADGRVNDVAVDADGRAVVVGQVRGNNQQNGDAFAARFTALLEADADFGEGDGFAITPLGRSDDEALAVSIPSGSSIPYLAGYAQNRRRTAAVAKLTEVGALDTSYGQGGVAPVAVSVDDVARDVYVDGQQNAFVTGRSRVGRKGATYDLLLAKLGPSGAPDPTFGGGDGFVTTAVGAGDDLGRTITADHTGALELVVGGVARAAGTTFGGDLVLARYDGATGTLDDGFGVGGTATLAIGHSAESANAVVEVAGEAIVTGASQTSTSMTLYAARFGEVVEDVEVPAPDGRVWRFAGGAARQVVDDNTYVVMAATASGNGDDFAIVRLDAATMTLDTLFGDGGDGGYQLIDIGTVRPTRTTLDAAMAVAVDGY